MSKAVNPLLSEDLIGTPTGPNESKQLGLWLCEVFILHQLWVDGTFWAWIPSQRHSEPFVGIIHDQRENPSLHQARLEISSRRTPSHIKQNHPQTTCGGNDKRTRRSCFDMLSLPFRVEEHAITISSCGTYCLLHQLLL